MQRYLVTAALSVLATGAAAITLPPAPPLPPPSGNVVTVSNVGQLQNAVAALTPGTTISIEPGTYALTQTLVIGGGVTNVALRGATNDRDDVVILGSGMATSGVNIGVQCRNAQDVLVANLSIGEVFWHPLQLQGEQGCDTVHLYNLRLFDAGEQFVKGTVDFANPDGVDNGIVEYCLIEYTVIGPADGYTNGVDIHHGDGWIIRHNLFRNIRVPQGAQTTLGPAVLMWSGSSNTVCDSNVFLECERAIAFGLGPQNGFPHSHSGGLICNNFIYREASTQVDTSINVWDSPDTKVLHNTVIQNGTYPNAIEYRFAGTTGVVIENNLTDGAIPARDGATGTVAGNLTNATPDLFLDTPAGDLHLLPTAAAALDQGLALADCPADWDGDGRPYGAGRDIGADEWTGFLDVPPSHPFHDYVNTIARNGITVGCGGGNFCPDASVTRAEMAVFLLKSKLGASHVPPPASGAIFADVHTGDFAADWIEELAGLGVTSGCLVNPLRYCPNAPVSRGEMAVFLLKMLLGSSHVPPAAAHIFGDVPPGYFAIDWIEDLYNRNITGGCQSTPLLYCPDAPNTRGQMAVFLTLTFGLQ
jgi:hypothetical protein